MVALQRNRCRGAASRRQTARRLRLLRLHTTRPVLYSAAAPAQKSAHRRIHFDDPDGCRRTVHHRTIIRTPLLTCSKYSAPTRTTAHHKYIRSRIPDHIAALLDRELYPSSHAGGPIVPGRCKQPSAVKPLDAMSRQERRNDFIMQVCNLFISPGQNFYGHHGQPVGECPNPDAAQIECVARRGISVIADSIFEGELGRIICLPELEPAAPPAGL